ncbi:MAG TPA: flavodoxin family protein [Thomasclavelia ramosa]|nr:flavodoxin family protein [Thomasclavelia ramosa]
MKKIVVISSSPRKNGNSEILADQFIKGATSVGHKVIKINLANYRIAPCLACEYCRGHHNRCVLKDDANKVIEEIVNADVFVMATPVYFYSLSAQLKILIDRMFAREYEIRNSPKRKTAYLIVNKCTEQLKALEDLLRCSKRWMKEELFMV